MAEDLAHDVFVKAWKNRHSWKPTAPVGGWLHRIAVNTAISYTRKKEHQLRQMQFALHKSGKESTVDEFIGQLPDYENGIDDFLANESFEELLSPLKERDRAILRMKFGEGLKNRKELVRRAGMVTEEGVSSAIFNAVKRLRKHTKGKRDVR